MFLLVCREGTFQALNAMPALISITLPPLRNEKELKKLLPFADNSADFLSIMFCIQRKQHQHLLHTVASLVMMPVSFKHRDQK